MNIQHNNMKDDLRRDPLVEFLVSVKGMFQKQGKRIGSVALVALVVAAGVLVYNSVRARSDAKAQQAFGAAMSQVLAQDTLAAIDKFKGVADSYRRSRYAGYAAYMLGSIYVQQGAYQQAQEWLSMASSVRSTGFIKASSNELLALAYEGTGDVAKAYDSAKKALDDKNSVHDLNDLNWKMALWAAKLQRIDAAKAHCQSILADTVASEYQQMAENLLTELQHSSN